MMNNGSSDGPVEMLGMVGNGPKSLGKMLKGWEGLEVVADVGKTLEKMEMDEERSTEVEKGFKRSRVKTRSVVMKPDQWIRSDLVGLYFHLVQVGHPCHVTAAVATLRLLLLAILRQPIHMSVSSI